MDYIPYNSRNGLHKSVFGAVKEGENIVFKVVLPRNLSCSKVLLVIRKDKGENKYYSMNWLSMEGENEEWWALGYTAKESGIYFYHFEYDTPWGRTSIKHVGDCSGRLYGGKLDWQLSVYERNFNTPNWLKGGIIYQIFPDRFNFSNTAKNNVPSGRKLRNDWGGEPEWRPTDDGKVLNNDYFQGDLKGIEEKLPYLESLGVSSIYLNPIFEAQSNHRYDTADYSKIDPLLGTEKDFSHLCDQAKKYNISIILDGVFSHTGDDSIYFNKYNRYKSVGAYQSKESEYFSWYKFVQWPDDYQSWWGINILPEVIEESDGFLNFITGKNGIARKWLSLGARGWRLDVADELPDVFLDRFREAVKAENKDAIVLGEVWEDASNKISYGERRHYFQGKELDSVMNYPFADAIFEFVKTGKVEGFSNKIYTILENYPKCVVDVLMNHIGTHDTMRAITQLVGESCEYRNREWQSQRQLTDEQYKKGVALLKLASVIQFTLPGVPSIYYGDEAGMTGYKDPFNRKCYPWGNENIDLVEHYKALGKMRKSCKCLVDGEFYILSEMLSCLAFGRKNKTDEILVIINRNDHEIDYFLPDYWYNSKAVFGGEMQGHKVKMNPFGCVVLKKEF